MLGEQMELEIRQQPAVLSANADRYLKDSEEFVGKGKSYDMVLLAARGTSDHAALYARYLIEVHLGTPVSLAAPSVLTRYGKHVRYPRCLAIGISQSGAAPDVSEVLTALREDGHDTLAITNTPDSRITAAAAHSILLNAGKETALAATKTYTASLLALYQLVRALGANLGKPELPDDAWLEISLEAAEAASGVVVRSEPLFSLARGYDFATANETALKLMECALLSCKAYSNADFEHGPKALATHGSAAILFGNGPDLSKQGCEVTQSPSANVSEEIQPIWQIIFGQWLALSVARSRGLNPDRVQHLKKVTETR